MTERSRGIRARTPAISLAFLLSGAVALVPVLRNAPAYAQGLRVEGLTGETRLLDSSAMYDQADYLMQTAVGYVNSNLVSYAATEAPDEIAPLAVLQQRIATAADLLERAIARDPGNAAAWAFYAQALALAVRLDDSRAALATARELAPNQPYLALQRVLTMDILHGVMSRRSPAQTFSMAELQAGSRDLQLVQGIRPEAKLRVPDWAL